MLEKDDVFEAGDVLYCVLDQINYGGHVYSLCNIMENEKTFGAKYIVFESFEDGIEQVTDDDLLNEISTFFSNNANAILLEEEG